MHKDKLMSILDEMAERLATLRRVINDPPEEKLGDSVIPECDREEIKSGRIALRFRSIASVAGRLCTELAEEGIQYGPDRNIQENRNDSGGVSGPVQL